MPSLRPKIKSNSQTDDSNESAGERVLGRDRKSRKISSDNHDVQMLDDSDDDNDSGNEPVDDGKNEAKQNGISTGDRTRRSGRSTKFSNSMAEPSYSIRDVIKNGSGTGTGKTDTTKSTRRRISDFSEEGEKEEKVATATVKRNSDRIAANTSMNSPKSSPNVHKSPARRHLTNRKVVVASDTSDDDDESEASSDDEEDNEPLKIQRILASRTEKKSKWKEICKKMNSSEIDFGSRWNQDDERIENGNKDDNDPFEERFLVKWWDLSYLHCSWETQADIVDQIESKSLFPTFFKKSQNGLLYSADERCDGDYFDPSYIQIERILQITYPDNVEESGKVDDEDMYNETSFGMVHDKSNPTFDEGTGRQFLVKWGNLQYTDATYEFERDLIMNDIEYKTHVKSFLRRSTKMTKTAARIKMKRGEDEFKRMFKVFASQREEDIEQFKSGLQERVYKNGGQLRDYQAEGVAWMISNYVQARSSILCDEMGLGKTLQTAATTDLMKKTLFRTGPILIIAPLSTLSHWNREFARWTDLNSIIYHGSAEDRKLIREFEFAFECDRPPSVGFNTIYLRKCNSKRLTRFESPWMVDVVITTPEMITSEDYNELASIPWEALVVDEAHRMKNHNSKLGVNLRSEKFSFRHKILLTGTPIQNDVQEFWTILNFIDPEKFSGKNEFMQKYGDMKSKERVDELHDEIRPFILRRLKEDVEKSVPPKEETLIEVELTIAQKQYYRALYEKNVKFLLKNKTKALDGPSMNNLAMQLRKVCNHLFLLNGIEIEFRDKQPKNLTEAELLVQGSGKLVLLDKLLPRLKEEGHRVLVFSQFKIMLDILEDYFHAREMKFERIDGSITGNKRQQAIDRFQAPKVDSKEAPFIMMLTTRAGGVGINLTAADTCIIFDSDWNPQNDLQAQARCHRIGQTKSVKIYRLLSRKTYEMQMFHISSLKMGLDQAVLNGMEKGISGESTLSKEEVEKLLRHGAYDIFNEDKSGNAEAESNAFVQLDIDSILQRRSRTVVHEATGSNSGAAGGTFSKASFKSTGVGNLQGNADDVDIEDPDFWKKMIGEPQADDDIDVLLTKTRQRKQVMTYSEVEYNKQLLDTLGDSDIDSDTAYESDDDPNHLPGEGRFKWGGSGPHEWQREDAEDLARCLATIGYGRKSWTEVVLLSTLRKSYDITEVKRMCWSFIFTVIKESVEEDTEAFKKKEESTAEKNRIAGSTSSEGGILGVQSGSTPNIGDQKSIKNMLFRKIIDSILSWFTKVFEDALLYANNNSPRDDSIIEKAKNVKKEETVDVTSIFSANIWPSLKNRGWKVSFVSEGSLAGKSIYNYKEKEYSSTSDVLAAARILHPELKNVIDTILEQSKPKSKPTTTGEESEFRHLTLSALNYDVFDSLLYKYAPLQLLVDRSKSNRIKLKRKILSWCTFLDNASIIMSKFSDVETEEAKVEKLANSIFIDKRFLLPHPLWTTRHDAVLIQSIAKHGWIDQDSSCRAITSDQDIKWGYPFDSSNSTSTKRDTNNFSPLRIIASRAAQFLNENREVISELKGFNQHLIIRAFGLMKDSSSKWIADPNALQDPNDARSTSGINVVELPTQKDLVRRAKVVLSKSTFTMESFAPAPNPKPSYNFAIIDQSDCCNLLLAETVRALIKESFGSKLNAKLCYLAMNEAKNRLAELSLAKEKNDASNTDYERIIKGLDLVKRNLNKSVRLYKNVLRVMLGEDPQRGKHPDEGIFPSERSSLASSTVADSKRTNIKSDLKLTCDDAVEKARQRLLDRYSTKEGIASIGKGLPTLELTEIETLILSAICTLGLPIWSENWRVSISISTMESNDLNHWSRISHFVSKYARSQVNKNEERAMKASRDFSKFKNINSSSNTEIARLRANAKSHVDKAKLFYESKVEVLRQAKEYQSNFDHLAKKSILLLAKLATSFSASTKLGVSDGALGLIAFKWFESEICRWAKCLDLLSDNGQPLAFTAVDFLDDLPKNDKALIEIYASFDQKACEIVIGQAALITRLRSIVTKSPENDLMYRCKEAVRRVTLAGDVWEMHPPLWNGDCDLVLLKRLCQYGFKTEVLMTRETFGVNPKVTNVAYSDSALDLSKGALQARANQLIRQLSIMEENVNALHMSKGNILESFVSKKSDVPESGTPHSDSDGDVEIIEPHQFVGNQATKRSLSHLPSSEKKIKMT